MAFQMQFIDNFGHDLPTSYWRLSSFSFDRVSRRAVFHFHCWVDKATHDAGKSPVALRTIDAVDVEFDQIAQILTSGFGAQVYDFARTRADHQTGVDANGNPVYASFFASAIDIV